MALLAAYSFDEPGGTVIDYSGNGNAFSLTSSALRVAGHLTGSGLQANSATPLTLPNIGKTIARTVMMWVKSDLASDDWLIEWHSPAANSGAWGILGIQGKITVQAENASEQARAQTTWTGTTSTWRHVAGTYDGSTVCLYVDGVLADCASLVAPLRTDTDPPALLGLSTTPVIDDLRIYDSALDRTAIVAAMSTVVARDDNTKSAALAVDAAFINRVTVAAAHHAVIVGQAFLASPTQSAVDKARYLFARELLASPTTFGARLAWAIAADASVDGTVDDATIGDKVSSVWNLFAGIPV